MRQDYKSRAEELREAAKLAKGDAARKELLLMADECELLANVAEWSSVSAKPSSQKRSS